MQKLPPKCCVQHNRSNLDSSFSFAVTASWAPPMIGTVGQINLSKELDT